MAMIPDVLPVVCQQDLSRFTSQLDARIRLLNGSSNEYKCRLRLAQAKTTPLLLTAR